MPTPLHRTKYFDQHFDSHPENSIPFSYIGDDNQPWLGRLLYYTLDAGVGFPILRRPKRVDSHRVFSVGILYTCGLARGNYLSMEGAKIE